MFIASSRRRQSVLLGFCDGGKISEKVKQFCTTAFFWHKKSNRLDCGEHYSPGSVWAAR
jgi:hypothetical protein